MSAQGQWPDPRLGIGEDPPHTETLQRAPPRRPGPPRLVANEFGKSRHRVDERVAGERRGEGGRGARPAENSPAPSTNITTGDNLVEIRTFLPDTRRGSGLVTMEVNYDITVPAGTSPSLRQLLRRHPGPGLSGLVAVESQTAWWSWATSAAR